MTMFNAHLLSLLDKVNFSCSFILDPRFYWISQRCVCVCVRVFQIERIKSSDQLADNNIWNIKSTKL